MAASEAIIGLEAKTEFDRAIVWLRFEPTSAPLFEALGALTGCPNVEDYLWHKLRGADANGVWRICATPETRILHSLERRLKRLLAEEAALTRGALYVPPTMKPSLIADCDPLVGAELFVNDWWVVVNNRDGTEHYPRLLPRLPPATTGTVVAARPVGATTKARRGGGKRGPSYKLTDEIIATIRQWAAANKGVSPLPKLKRLWAEENKDVKTPPSDMTFRRLLENLELWPGKVIRNGD
jgi:hypothetical protein